MTVTSSIVANKTKTALIMVLFMLFVATVGFIYGKTINNGLGFAAFAFIFAALSSFGSFFWSDKLVLATMGAKKTERKDFPQLYAIIESLVAKDNLPMPKIYVVKSESPNAFATGRDPKHAVVAVTTGILEQLNKVELEGVIAHELSHVKNFDTRLMGVVAILVGFVVLLGNFFMQNMWFSRMRNRDDRDNNANILLLVGIAFALLSPIVATLIQLSISRKRELLADASGALLTRYPKGLADALEKISKDPRSMHSASNATAHLFIVNPFKGKDSTAWFTSLFNTHPPIEERIRILRAL